jgi:hypothetical protein
MIMWKTSFSGFFCNQTKEYFLLRVERRLTHGNILKSYKITHNKQPKISVRLEVDNLDLNVISDQKTK